MTETTNSSKHPAALGQADIIDGETRSIEIAKPRGRPPVGERAMTGAERKRRHRAKFHEVFGK
jgi:hypothetical protein